MTLKNTPVHSVLYSLGFFIRIIKGTVYFLQNWRAYYKILVMQILFTFVEALGIASLLALGIGAAANVIGVPFLTGFSQERLIYSLLIAVITRELGPLLAALIIAARSATAIATEIAGMVISHEVEAYISIGVDPIEYLAVPRFLGVTISMFLLNIYFSIFGLAGSFVVAQLFNPLPADVYFFYILQILTLQDIVISIVKSIFFGMIISVVALLEGFSVQLASTEIPVAGLKAVSAAFAWCIMLNIPLTIMYYMVM
ncbi:MAG: ABC transporter permease [Treponema sp.]|jgi:phospholipid/cholesterol/gamma-HCH transport system permease protein|nr:ABC transporter permease [Treponema sp.]